ncbi:YegJ family protein [Bradyrhizobium sp. AUGA SZCCT0431]|uniref:YegJ family protein n=1 Tax=Bradyrhizobium sp. AUGA SZCCT0431 TaxID=2807674 RepID=UPI003908A96D
MSVRAEDRSPVIDFRNGDPEINAAIALARSTLPKFWASYQAPKPSETGHSLKVRFPYGSNSGEHIWMADVKKIADGRYSGQFANTPRHLPGKRAGDLAEFREADISDWMFLRNGKIVGGETIRPMLKMMSKADADELRARMETP